MMKICLYLPIAPSQEFLPIRRNKKDLAKTTLKDLWFYCSAIFGGFALDVYSFTKKTSTNRGDIAIGEAIREQLQHRAGPAFLDVMWGHLGPETVARINAEADLFVICGGGYVFLDIRGELNRRLEDVAWLERIHCPTAAYGIGFNRLLDEGPYDPDDPLPPRTIDKLQRLSGACQFMSVRDASTAELFTRWTGRTPEVTGDPALFLEPAPVLRRRSPDRLTIGLNFAVHGPEAVVMIKKLLPTALAGLRRIDAQYRPRWVYMQHSDEEAAVLWWLRARGFRIDEVVDGGPRQLLAAYAGLDLAICQMLHSCILAANARVPMVNIAYDLKNTAFFELMGLPQQCLSHDRLTPERLLALVGESLERRAEIADQLRRRKAELAAATGRFADQLIAVAAAPQAAAG